ncbi:helix-turn-helix domain-containing protein [Caulobacter vibrioides]|uniref:helix-turn-helix domain-containing protein n=1 Tax=Caulobacter vibrioides TaxID=155892 RepID=UPI000A2F7C78
MDALLPVCVVDEKKHLQIKEALHARGLSIGGIARNLGVTKNSVSLVCRGYRRSRRLEQAIAHALDLEPARLWPERY